MNTKLLAGSMVFLITVAVMVMPMLSYAVTPKPTSTAPEDFMRLPSFLEGFRRVVAVKAFNASKGLIIDVELKAGGVEIMDNGEAPGIIVEIAKYTPLWFTLSRNRSFYNVNYQSSTNTLKVVSSGYEVKIRVPKDYVNAIKCYVNGGGCRLKLRSSSLKDVDGYVSAGGIEASLKGLKGVNLNLNVMSGGLKAELEYLSCVGASKVFLTISGGGDLKIKVPSEVKISSTVDVTAGGVSVKLNGHDIPSNYVDEGFASAASKLVLSCKVVSGELGL